MKKNALIATVLGAVALSMSFSAVYAAEVSQTVCQSTKEYNISPVTSGATYAWGVDNATAGTDYNITLETAPTNSKATVEWLTATPASTTFDLWSQETSQYGCVGPKSIVHVTVSPLPEVDPASNNICSTSQSPSAGTPVDIVNLDLPAATNGATVTKWNVVVATNGATPGTGNFIGGDTTNSKAIYSDTYTNSTTATIDVVYTITPYAGECAGSAVNYTITVYPEVVAPTITF